MKAWFWVKAVIGVIGIGTMFFAGYMTGASSASETVDLVQIRQLASCLPINDIDELGKCTGLKIVGGQ